MKRRLGINLGIARSCFVRCIGCYNHFGKSAELPTREILAFLALARKRGVTKITLCGGDPLAHSDIIGLLEGVKALGFTISLDTVGTTLLGDAITLFFGMRVIPRLPPEKLARLVDMIGVPLDGATNESMTVFRSGRPNLLDEEVEIIRLLDSHNARLCINTVVHRTNFAELEPILNIISPFRSVAKWQLFQFTPTGPLGFRNRHMFAIDTPTFLDVTNRIRELAIRTDFSGAIEAKSHNDRKHRYLLVDSDGQAWLPSESLDQEWNPATDANDQRIIVGNITRKADHETILGALFERLEATNPWEPAS